MLDKCGKIDRWSYLGRLPRTFYGALPCGNYPSAGASLSPRYLGLLIAKWSFPEGSSLIYKLYTVTRSIPMDKSVRTGIGRVLSREVRFVQISLAPAAGPNSLPVTKWVVGGRDSMSDLKNEDHLCQFPLCLSYHSLREPFPFRSLFSHSTETRARRS